MWVGAYLAGGLLFVATAATLPPPEDEPVQATTEPEPTGSGKFGDKCKSPEECGFRGSHCENGACGCRPELPATNHFDKCGVEVDINGTCFFHEQCEVRVRQTECKDNRCSCRFEMKSSINKMNQVECIALYSSGQRSMGTRAIRRSYHDRRSRRHGPDVCNYLRCPSPLQQSEMARDKNHLQHSKPTTDERLAAEGHKARQRRETWVEREQHQASEQAAQPRLAKTHLSSPVSRSTSLILARIRLPQQLCKHKPLGPANN